MKKEKGVTLVALVVTIIVLIILAGISINLVLGDNGIITIAKKAKENTELAKVQEETELNELYTQLETNESNSDNTSYDAIAKLIEFKKIIAQGITDEGVSTSSDSSAEEMVENIKKILQVRTSDATATPDNITEGKTAYVNGELITGFSSNSGYDKAIYKQQKTSAASQPCSIIVPDDCTNGLLICTGYGYNGTAPTVKVSITDESGIKSKKLLLGIYTGAQVGYITIWQCEFNPSNNITTNNNNPSYTLGTNTTIILY